MIGIENYAYADVIYAIIIIAVFVVISYIVYFLIEKVFSKIVKRTKTTLDEKILDAIKKPIILAIIFVGIYLGLSQIKFFVNYYDIIEKIFTLIYILIGTLFVTNIFNAFFKWYDIELNTKVSIDKEFISTLKKIIFVFVYIIALMLILKQVFNVEITPILASLGIAGLAVALALKDTLSNFFAGINIVVDKIIKFDDYIELENGMKGYVVDIGWRSTKIRTLENNIIIIPNSKLMESIITNYFNFEKQMNVAVECGVSYNSDLEKVEKITIEVAKEVQQNTQGAVKNFEPFIRYNKFGDSNINFKVFLRIEKYADQYPVIHEFIKKLKARYDKEGIEISFPVRNIYFKKEEILERKNNRKF